MKRHGDKTALDSRVWDRLLLPCSPQQRPATPTPRLPASELRNSKIHFCGGSWAPLCCGASSWQLQDPQTGTMPLDLQVEEMEAWRRRSWPFALSEQRLPWGVSPGTWLWHPDSAASPWHCHRCLLGTRDRVPTNAGAHGSALPCTLVLLEALSHTYCP